MVRGVLMTVPSLAMAVMLLGETPPIQSLPVLQLPPSGLPHSIGAGAGAATVME